VLPGTGTGATGQATLKQIAMTERKEYRLKGLNIDAADD